MGRKRKHPDDLRNVSILVMFTKAEAAAVRRVAEQLGMSHSGAGRFLSLRGLESLSSTVEIPKESSSDAQH